MFTFDTPLLKRFWDKVRKDNYCWEWTAGSRGKTGYGSLKVNKKVIDSHRVSWMIYFGSIPDGMCVCHKCDNRKCIRPDHLFLGTKGDNNRDMFRKGRNTPQKRGRITVPQHGTSNEYKTYGCRCDPCKEAARLYQQKWRSTTP
jgi:hypothetical protein